MSIEENIKHVEISIERAQELIERRDRLYRLMDNPDFEELFMNDLFKEEPARLLMLKADPEVKFDEKVRVTIDEMIDMVGNLRQWFFNIERGGNQAEHDLKAHQETREELLAEQLEDSTVQ